MKKLLFGALLFLAPISMVHATDIELTGNITSDMKLMASNTYYLNGFVRVMNNATLTIEPGTTIYGKNGTKASLIVRPGSKLLAEGTASSPIVFTSENTKPGSPTEPQAGDWGGIILLGNARVNTPTTPVIEGTGDATDTYGGQNDDDNSGILKYVRIEYPGIAYEKDKEINGLTFGGVGRGTVIDYVQVSYSGDDSFEWFGGTVNCKHLIAYRGVDDDFDTDFGYSGKLQFLLGIKDPQIADQAGASNGFESDNDGSGSLNNPRTSPTWWNVTLIGPKETSSTVADAKFAHGMHLRRSSQNKINNLIVMGYPKAGIYIDGSTTNADAKAGTWYVKNSIVAGNSKIVDTTKSGGKFDITSWFAGNFNRSYTAASETGLNDPFNLLSVNAMPKPESPAFTGGAVPPNDGFFDNSADFVGAFGNENWTIGWARHMTLNTTDIEDTDNSRMPSAYQLSQNFPNPFNPSTKISYSIPNSGYVKLIVYNVLGKEVATLVNEVKPAGDHTVSFNASNLNSGVYFYSLESGNTKIVKKMTLMK